MHHKIMQRRKAIQNTYAHHNILLLLLPHHKTISALVSGAISILGVTP